MEISISVETTGSLGRRMTVQVPAERVEQEIDDRLKSVSRNAKMKGFRPGKVPMTVIRQKFGGQVRQEVLGEIMQTSYSEAISRENLTPAGAPQIAADNRETGQDLKYTATFEVYPQIELKGLFDFSIEKPQPEITNADMDAMLENLRKQKAVWETIKRAAKEGDRVSVDFDGEIGGEAFEGGHGENVSVVIGSGQMLSDFENGLSGISTGEVREVKVKFPK
ncbi:MAG: trigger factor, partial [Gammaproteobacteria bacterium]